MENKEQKGRGWIFWLILISLGVVFWAFKHYPNPEGASKIVQSTGGSVGMNLFYIAAAVAGIIVLLYYMGKFQRKSFGGNNNIKIHITGKSTEKQVTFADVAGVDEVKEELREVVDFLKNNEKYGRLGGRMPKGVLLVGPPGTGKTLLAKAVAGEAGVPFLWMSGSEFVEMFVGVGASRVRELFRQARKKAPCIIFIDELDAIGKVRGAGIGQNHNENEQTLNQILVEMDGFKKDEHIILLAATNRPDVLDPAILRPGRFDRRVVVSNPDLKGREAILRVHAKDRVLVDNWDLNVIARATAGASGADLANIINEAALLAERKEKRAIALEDFKEAEEKISMGKEKPMVMSDKVKRVSAVHEAGHAIVILSCSHSDKLNKVSIIPRTNGALGVTTSLSGEDRFFIDKEWAKEQIEICLGGRAAEDVVLGSITSGARRDLETATNLLEEMISRCGMDEKIGLAVWSSGGNKPFLGRSYALNEGVSQQRQYEIEQRIETILDESYARVKSFVERNKDKVIKLIDALLEKETLDREQVEKIVGELN